MTSINHCKEERDCDVRKILESKHRRRVVVAGPGTGKSFLFQQEIKNRKREGKDNFLAITFIGRLCEGLADDLAGLAKTLTMHGFARNLLLSDKASKDNWNYYPDIKSIIQEDLVSKGIDKLEIGSEDYRERTTFYKAYGDDDVIHYAVQHCKKNPEKTPQYDLILVDEFQDFNSTESEFIDILAKENKMLIVGDDDQALYGFKGSSPKFIRDKYNDSNFESRTLRFCSRCTQVLVCAFHNIVDYYERQGILKNRINKEYLCYTPDKKVDNDLNPKIILMNLGLNTIPHKIKKKLEELLRCQKIKSVLIIGDARTCKKILSNIAERLCELGFKDVKHASIHQEIFSLNTKIVNAYKFLKKDPECVLAWRLLYENKEKRTHLDSAEAFIESIPADFRKKHTKNAKTLCKIIEETKSVREKIPSSSIKDLKDEIVECEKEQQKVFVDHLVANNTHLPRPLENLDITVCNILGSKGLGADVVFLVGFDQEKFPQKQNPDESEVYQFLVAITRAKKRVYLINTIGKAVSVFKNSIDDSFIETSQ